MLDPIAITAIAAVSVPFLTMLFYALGEARWKGKVEERLDTVEKGVETAQEGRNQLRDRVSEIEQSINLELKGIHSKLSELIGQLKGSGAIK